MGNEIKKTILFTIASKKNKVFRSTFSKSSARIVPWKLQTVTKGNFFPDPHPRIFVHCFSRERKGEKEKSMWQRTIDLLTPRYTWTKDRNAGTRVWTCNLSMCPDWELNLQPFSYGTTLQPTEPHRPGWRHFIISNVYDCKN